MKDKIRIAIQKKGRLKENSLNFLSSLGLKFKRMENELIVPCKNIDIEILFVRNSDIPVYVKNGATDFGIVGENVIYERSDRFKILKKLGFACCKLVIAVPNDSLIKNIKDLQDERIATSYVESLKRYLGENLVSASLIYIKGSVEIAPQLNLADAVCDITQTGNTLRENNLKQIATILESQAVLIESPFKNNKKKIFLKLLK